MRFYLTLISLFSFFSAFAQPKTLEAFNADTSVFVIDGDLSEEAWQKGSAATNFIQNSPNPGKLQRYKTQVKIAYTIEGVYIGAKLFDAPKDSVPSELTNRDETGNASFFGVSFSPYNDGQNGFEFFTTSAGVQVDTKIVQDNQDYSWNGVWENKVKWFDWGWAVEMFIPFTNLRFPKAEVQNWAFQMTRYNRRYRETEFWNPVNPAQSGFLNQAGVLAGLKDLNPPIRLAVFPYVSAYYEQFGDAKQTTFNGGMDVKWGISDAFTLDATLIPDFGQVQSDDQVLNLSPFEVQFNEYRQFFTEGTELFNKAGLFYSRRVGGRPLNVSKVRNTLQSSDTLTKVPSSTELINATKISGRTKGGLGVGVFNAVTRASFATVRSSDSFEKQVEVNPLSNYWVVVLDQNLKYNSFVSFTNTNVYRSGSTYDANVSALNFKIKNKPNTLFAEGGLYNSILTNDETKTGQQYYGGLGKVGGKFNYGTYAQYVTPDYDHNDLGFFTEYNYFLKQIYASYNRFTPLGIFNSINQNVTLSHKHRIEPFTTTSFDINLNAWAVLKSFDGLGYTIVYQPETGKDFFSTRTENRYFKTPDYFYANAFFSSDYRRTLAIDLRAAKTNYNLQSWSKDEYTIAPRWRVNNKCLLVLSHAQIFRKNEIGYALSNNLGSSVLAENPPTNYNESAIYYGKRNVRIHENIFSAKYTFTPTLNTNFRLRHQWVTLKNKEVFELATDGSVIQTPFTGESAKGESYYNSNFNTLNLDFTLRWIFVPGSELSVNWKKIIINTSDNPLQSYADSYTALQDLQALDSVSIKVLYYLDYVRFKKLVNVFSGNS